METMDNERIVVVLNGKEVECDVLFTFTSDDTGKGYIGYTDHSFDANGRKNIYVSSYDPVLAPDHLSQVTDPDELQMVMDVLEDIKKTLDNE